MLSFKPKKNNILTFSELPAQLVDYETDGDVTKFSLRLNFYLDPIKLIQGEIVSAKIDIASSVFSRPGIFENVENFNTGVRSNFLNRVRDIKFSQNEYQKTKVLASANVDILSYISQELSDEIINFLNSNSRLEKVLELMPKFKFAENKKIRKIKAGDVIVEPAPYESQNFAVELFSNLGINSLDVDENKIKELINEIVEKNISLSELATFPYALNGAVLDYKNPLTVNMVDIISSKNLDLGSLTSDNFEVGNETLIHQLYQYYIKLKNRTSISSFLTSRDVNLNKINVSTTIDFISQTSINRPIKLIFYLLNENSGIREKIVQDIPLNRLLRDYNLPRVSPYISAAGVDNYANVFIRQRDKNAKGVALYYRESSGTTYQSLARIDLGFNEEYTYVDETFYSDSINKSRSYRVHVIDSNGNISPVFNDSNLVLKTPVIGEIELNNQSSSGNTTCFLDEIGESAESGKRLVSGVVDIDYKKSTFTIYRNLISENGLKIGERIPIDILPKGSENVVDSITANNFSFLDEVEAGIWRYEIEATNESFQGVIHECEIIIDENISYNDDNSMNLYGEISQAKIQNTTKYLKTDSELITTTTLNIIDGGNVYVNIDDIEVNFSNSGNNFSLKGTNTFSEIDENILIVETKISNDELKSAIEASTGNRQTDSSVDDFLKSTTNNHSLLLGVE